MTTFYEALTEEEKRYLDDVMTRNLLTKLFGLPLVGNDDVVKVLAIFDKLLATEGAEVPQALKDYASGLRHKYSVKPQNAPSSTAVQ